MFIRTSGTPTARLYVSNDMVGGRWTRISAGDVATVEAHDLVYVGCEVIHLYTITGSNTVRVAMRDATSAG